MGPRVRQAGRIALTIAAGAAVAVGMVVVAPRQAFDFLIRGRRRRDDGRIHLP